MKPFNVFPYDSNFDFMRLRVASLVVAFALVAVAIGAMATKGLNFALDFTGGVGVELHFPKPVDAEDVRRRLDQAGFGGAQVQNFGTGNDLLVRMQDRSQSGDEAAPSIGQEVRRAASTADNQAELIGSASISAQVGKELALNGIWALLFVLIGFLIYISFRYELKFAIAAIITTIHDVVVVVGWFALSGHDFDLTVLAGALSVLGFSINDTIVVFDRVRENFRSMRADPMRVLNTSINQTLSRTVITSVVALLTALALYLYGGGSLRGMAESMIVGVVFGTLSSIFVACPLLLWLGVSKQDLLPKARDEAALARRP